MCVPGSPAADDDDHDEEEEDWRRKAVSPSSGSIDAYCIRARRGAARCGAAPRQRVNYLDARVRAAGAPPPPPRLSAMSTSIVPRPPLVMLQRFRYIWRYYPVASDRGIITSLPLRDGSEVL